MYMVAHTVVGELVLDFTSETVHCVNKFYYIVKSLPMRNYELISKDTIIYYTV